jgi:preprotein translocase subunit SecY
MGGMFETLRNAWKIPDLRKKILFTIFMLIILGSALSYQTRVLMQKHFPS